MVLRCDELGVESIEKKTVLSSGPDHTIGVVHPVVRRQEMITGPMRVIRHLPATESHLFQFHSKARGHEPKTTVKEQ